MNFTIHYFHCVSNDMCLFPDVMKYRGPGTNQPMNAIVEPESLSVPRGALAPGNGMHFEDLRIKPVHLAVYAGR